MAVDPRLAIAALPRVQRFGVTERRLHTIHAWAFSVLLLTGFVLYLPFLAQIVSDRPLMKGIHLVTAVVWLTALALVALLGDRDALRRTRRDIERFDADDVLFVRTRGRSRVAGRFNGGQKAHAIAQAGLTVLFTVSGVLLWLGERDTAFRLPGTIALHDAATLLLAVLVPATSCRRRRTRSRWRASGAGRCGRATRLSTMRRGTPGRRRPSRAPSRAGAGRIALAAAVVVLGIAAAVALV